MKNNKWSDPRTIVFIIVVNLLAASVWAGSSASVSKAPGFKPSDIKLAAIVTAECHESIDCNKVENAVLGAIHSRKLGIKVIPSVKVRQTLFKLGILEYSEKDRQRLSEALEIDAVIEVRTPFAKKGDGWGGRKGSEITLVITFQRPDGEILLNGRGVGRAINKVSDPESLCGKLAKMIFDKAFKKSA